MATSAARRKRLREYHRAWSAKNGARIRAYYQKHREVRRVWSAEYYLANRDRILAKMASPEARARQRDWQRSWRLAHPEKHRKRSRQFYRDHRGLVLARMRAAYADRVCGDLPIAVASVRLAMLRFRSRQIRDAKAA